MRWSRRARRATAARRRFAPALLALALLAAVLNPAAAQAPPELEVISVLHDPRGVLEVAVRSDLITSGAIDLTAVIDGLPRQLERDAIQETVPLALSLVVDTSGSMVGVPMRAAREAGEALIVQLPPEHRLGLISFDTDVVVRSDLTTEHASVVALVRQLEASGWTALYGAMDRAASMLEGVPEDRRVVVLLSDGMDFGGVSTVTREESIERVVEAGATVYAVGLGPDYDEEYLIEIASATGGQFFGIRDETDVTSLTTLFTRLGGQLSATTIVRIPVPPMTSGTHELVLRSRIGGTTVTARSPFEVTNQGLLSPRTREAAEPGDPIAIEVLTLVSPELLQLNATAGDSAVSVTRGTSPSVLIDPWLYEPGPLAVRVAAIAGAGEIAAVETTVEVPRLSIAITAEQEGDEFIARWQAQPGNVAEAALIGGGQELTRSGSTELRAEIPAGVEQITVELYDAAGVLVVQQQVGVESPAPALQAPEGGFPWLPVLAVGALATVGVAVYLRRRRPEEAQRIRVRRLAASGPIERPDEPLRAVVVVVGPDGSERRYPLGPRPVSVGRSRDCDIVVEDAEVRAVHARITATRNGTYRVHGVGGISARPYERGESDEWLVLEPQETIALGGYLLSIHPAEESNGA